MRYHFRSHTRISLLHRIRSVPTDFLSPQLVTHLPLCYSLHGSNRAPYAFRRLLDCHVWAPISRMGISSARLETTIAVGTGGYFAFRSFIMGPHILWPLIPAQIKRVTLFFSAFNEDHDIWSLSLVSVNCLLRLTIPRHQRRSITGPYLLKASVIYELEWVDSCIYLLAGK